MHVVQTSVFTSIAELCQFFYVYITYFVKLLINLEARVKIHILYTDELRFLIHNCFKSEWIFISGFNFIVINELRKDWVVSICCSYGFSYPFPFKFPFLTYAK